MNVGIVGPWGTLEVMQRWGIVSRRRVTRHHVRILGVRWWLGKHWWGISLRSRLDRASLWPRNPATVHLEHWVDMSWCAADDVGVEVLPGHDLLETVDGKSRVSELEQGLALRQLQLDVLSVAAGRQCLAMSVFLVAYGGRSGAGGASWMF